MLLGMLLADHDFLYEWLKAKQSSYNTRATNQKDVVGELVYQGWRGTVTFSGVVPTSVGFSNVCTIF